MKNNQRVVFSVLLAFIFTIFIGSILVTYQVIDLKVYSYFLLAFLPIELILYFLYKKRTSFQFSKKEILVFLLFFFTGISCIFGVNKKVAFLGFTDRYEGMFMIYLYYSTALLASTIQDKQNQKRLLIAILVMGICNVLYGFFQTELIPNHSALILNPWQYARGFQGNSMYFATLIGMCYFMVVSYFLNTEKLGLSFVLLLIFTTGNVLAGSMALLCTTIFIFLFLVGKELYSFRCHLFDRYRVIKLFFCILIFTFLSLILPNFLHNEYLNDIHELNTQVSSMSQDKKTEDSYGTGRVYIWKNTIQVIPKHLLFGVGADNFYYAFSPKLVDPVSNLLLDKAHNDYLQIFLCEGIFSFIIYMVLLISIVVSNYKTRDRVRQLLFLCFLSYIVEIFFSISVIRVAPIFWMILGMLLVDDEKISVIVPIYNSKKYLKKCLDSIVSQTYDNLEIILIDDASSDDSYKVYEKYLNDERVILVQNKSNQGVAYCRNLGIRIASSKYISFVDSDDYLFLDCMDYLYHLQKKYHTKISVCAREKNEEEIERKITQKEAFQNILSYGPLELCVTGKLFSRRQFWNIFFPKKVLYEDIPILEKIIFKNKYIAYSTYQKYVYHRNKNSITNQKYSRREKDRAKLSKDFVVSVVKKYPDLKDYGEYFYIGSMIAVCNKLLLSNRISNDYIIHCQKYIQKNIFVIMNLDVSFIKKSQMLLFMMNIRFYHKLYLVKDYLFWK